MGKWISGGCERVLQWNHELLAGGILSQRVDMVARRGPRASWGIVGEKTHAIMRTALQEREEDAHHPAPKATTAPIVNTEKLLA